MAFELIKYLKDPQLVASIQQFFGVKIHYHQHFEQFKSNKTWQNKQDGYTCTKTDCNKKNYIPACHQNINGCDTKNKDFNGCIKKTESVEQQRNDVTNNREEMVSNNSHYTITNSFWYYLFLFGTELGDELFYTTFIPFLFWNVDGAIGRRVVLVWAIVMSIGKIV
jgi:sphingosine-1-phosphate phosphatase 1